METIRENTVSGGSVVIAGAAGTHTHSTHALDLKQPSMDFCILKLKNPRLEVP